MQADAYHRRWRAMRVIADAQGQQNQAAEQRQNKQQRRIVVQNVNGTAEGMKLLLNTAKLMRRGFPT